MKFSRVFYFRAFYFRAPPFFSFSRKTNFRATAKKFGFTRLKHPDRILLVFGELKKKKTQNMSFKNRAILFSHTFSCANHSNSCGLYIQEHCAKIKLTRKFHELRYLPINFFLNTCQSTLFECLPINLLVTTGCITLGIDHVDNFNTSEVGVYIS